MCTKFGQADSSHLCMGTENSGFEDFSCSAQEMVSISS